MARTNSSNVQGILGDNFGLTASGVVPDLTPFIDAANVVVTQLVTMAAAKITPVTMTAAMLEQIERWLAAHFYCVADPLYTSRSTAAASGQFQVGTPDEGFGATEYG